MILCIKGFDLNIFLSGRESKCEEAKNRSLHRNKLLTAEHLHRVPEGQSHKQMEVCTLLL